MRESIGAEAFRASLDRRLSGLEADPLLARRIIAAEKGEIRMKKKLRVSLVCVLAVILGLATAACAVAALYRVVNWHGEVSRTAEPPSAPQDGAESEKLRRMSEELAAFMQDVPDDETVFAWFEDDRNVVCCSELHRTRETFSSGEDLLRFLSEVRTLTPPAWLPEGTAAFCSAKADLECEAFGTYETLAQGQAGPVRYTRFRIGGESAVPTGYTLILSLEDGSSYVITSELRTDSSDEALMLREGETAEEVAVPGMTDALLIRSAGPGYPDGLIMRRRLEEPLRMKQLPLSNHVEESDGLYYLEERVSVWGYGLREPGSLLRLFSGE